MAHEQDSFLYALSSNNAWASYKAHQNPQFFTKLAGGQAPKILWLGCSDSRCPETTILGLGPGDVFVHRNIANIMSPTDINTSAVIEYAVVHVGVQHVVLCGHSCCGGAVAVLSDARVGGVLDAWLTPLRAVRDASADELARCGDDDKLRAIRLAELNVEAGMRVLLANHVIRDAIRDRGLQVHGCLFDIASGRIRDLGFDKKLTAAVASSGERGPPAAAGAKKERFQTTGEVLKGKHAQLVFRDGGASMTTAR